MQNYLPSEWYWIVSGSASQVFSSRSMSYVANTDASYVAWTAKGNQATAISANDMLLLQIDLLEAKQTLRRMREATGGTDSGWLAALNTQIAALRAQLIT